jgi:hypothetical protein
MMTTQPSVFQNKTFHSPVVHLGHLCETHYKEASTVSTTCHCSVPSNWVRRWLLSDKPKVTINTEVIKQTLGQSAYYIFVPGGLEFLPKD